MNSHRMLNPEFKKRWSNFSLFEQLAHVGSDVDRALYWQGKGDTKTALNSLDIALELLDITISDSRWKSGLKELVRTREVLTDYFYGTNEFNTSDEFLKNYFLQFGLAARR